MKEISFALILILLPTAGLAQKMIEKDITWKKPDIYLWRREICLKYAASRNAVMISSDLINDLGASVKVRCRLAR